MFSQQPVHFSWDWRLRSQPREIWPFITDTNRLFKDVKQPSIRQAHLSQSVDPEFIQLSYNGINRYEVWEEAPYEWEYPYRFGVKRCYRSGPYKSLRIQVDLHPSEQGSRLQISFWINPRSNILSLFATLKLKMLLRNRIKKRIRSYDKLASHGKMLYQNERTKRLVRGGEKRLNEIKKELASRQIDAEIAEKLIDFISRADDLELRRIRPYKLADHWNYSRRQVLEVFVYAAKLDLLNFNWDLHCPKCRKIRGSVKTLNQVHERIYCEECEQEFKVDFNKTIQLRFTPHPLIRKINDKQYCLRGPQTKSHIFIQQYLNPGEKKYLKTQLPEGIYTLRSSQSGGTATIRISEKGSSTIYVELRTEGLRGEEVDIACDPNLTLKNSSSKAQLVTLERKSWEDTGASAAEITSSQLFRDLFTKEVLSKGEKISADNLTLMFTDLFDSAGMYNEEGDDKAVGQVIHHFEVLEQAIAGEGGAVVKTIGDSVMAVFCKPEHALKAYLRAKNMISEDDRFMNDFQMKAGIHQGSCVAVNLNNRIDYFGSTVNIASRFVDCASENEVVISQKAFSEHDLNQILKEYGKGGIIKNMNINLKGFEQESFSVKSLKIDDDSPLRLAI